MDILPHVMRARYSGVYIWRIVLMKQEAYCMGYLSGSRRELPIYFIRYPISSRISKNKTIRRRS
jgi:hypothetical protein